MRYETPDERGVTRRERNERYNQPVPDFIIPDGGQHLWDWYHELASGVGRIVEGVCMPIPWTEFLAWGTVADLIVRPAEYAILRAMDDVFCEETNKELQAYRKRLEDAAKRGESQDG